MIQDLHRKLNGLQNDRQKLLEALQATMTSKDHNTIINLIKSRANTIFDQVKEKQKKKYQSLKESSMICQHSQHNQKKKFVVNLSNRQLSTFEHNMLSLGLNFTVAPKQIPIDDIISGVEQGLSRAKVQHNTDIRIAVHQILRTSQKKPTSNLTIEEAKALKNLRKDNSIIILPADKGNATVILDREAYTKKMKGILHDGSYMTLRKDPTKKFERVTHQKLLDLMKIGELDKELYKKLNPTNSCLSCMYRLPKIHKDNVPLRPIISIIGSATYDLAKYLAKIISPLVGQTSSYVKNFSSFQ